MFLLISVFIAITIVTATALLNCPHSSTTFEKILGLRPSNDINNFLLYKDEDLNPVTTECLQRCFLNKDCLSVVVYFSKSECYWYRSIVHRQREHESSLDTSTAWFEKTCLEGEEACPKLWNFERVPGATLIGNDTKILPNTMTRQECQQHCLAETEFHCRSVKFQIFDNIYEDHAKTTGICTLSDTDRHLMPNSYRVSSFNEEYFENQCSHETSTQFCSYEEYENVILTHADLHKQNVTQSACQNFCETTSAFNCRGFSLLPNSLVDNRFTCLLHSEDSKIHGPKLLQDYSGAKYYEGARCLNISVNCTDHKMTIQYNPEISFHGKLYMDGYSDRLECYVTGNGWNTVTLRIPLFSNTCGVIEAKSPDYFNRTLQSATMVLQYNPIIQTQGDRIIKVGCIFGNETTLLLGTGVNFTWLHKGTVIINSTINEQPYVEMRIVDIQTGQEVTDTEIGQELQLIIEVKVTNNAWPYDIWAGHLVAMTENGQQSILLLDDMGCPTNLHIFPALTKHNSTNKQTKLTANFQAFKFGSSSAVRFSVLVQFCPDACQEIDCTQNSIPQTKRKRDISTNHIETINGTSVINISREQFDMEGKEIVQLPLEFVLVVHNARLAPDRLVYGENTKILVAGYDPTTNEVCVDYSLLIGVVVTWLLTQVLLVACCILMIKKYKRFYENELATQSLEELHKNFGLGFSNLESRRVHWADNGDLT